MSSTTRSAQQYLTKRSPSRAAVAILIGTLFASSVQSSPRAMQRQSTERRTERSSTRGLGAYIAAQRRAHDPAFRAPRSARCRRAFWDTVRWPAARERLLCSCRVRQRGSRGPRSDCRPQRCRATVPFLGAGPARVQRRAEQTLDRHRARVVSRVVSAHAEVARRGVRQPPHSRECDLAVRPLRGTPWCNAAY